MAKSTEKYECMYILNPNLTEEEMVSRAGEIVGLAGVQLRAYAEVQQKFNELLKSYKPSAHGTGVVERARIERKDGSGNNGENAGQGGGNGGGSGNNGENEE